MALRSTDDYLSEFLGGRPELRADVEPSSLADILLGYWEPVERTLGIPGRMMDVASAYYANRMGVRAPWRQAVTSGGFLGTPTPRGQLAAEAAFPREESRESYLKKAGRVAIDLILSAGSDPLMWAIGAPSVIPSVARTAAGARTSARVLGHVPAAEIAPEAGAALEAAIRAAKPWERLSRGAAAAFTPSMVHGTVAGAEELGQKIGEEGFSPEAFETALQTGTAGLFAGLGAKHALTRGLPRTGRVYGEQPRVIEGEGFTAREAPFTSAVPDEVPIFEPVRVLPERAPPITAPVPEPLSRLPEAGPLETPGTEPTAPRRPLSPIEQTYEELLALRKEGGAPVRAEEPTTGAAILPDTAPVTPPAVTVPQPGTVKPATVLTRGTPPRPAPEGIRLDELTDAVQRGEITPEEAQALARGERPARLAPTAQERPPAAPGPAEGGPPAATVPPFGGRAPMQWDDLVAAVDRGELTLEEAREMARPKAQAAMGPPGAERPTAEPSRARPRHEEDVQAEIDALEARYRQQGRMPEDFVRAIPEDFGRLRSSGLEPMPEDLAALYRERDAARARPAETAPRAEPEPPPPYEPPPRPERPVIARERVEEAFRGQEVRETPEGFEVATPSGTTVRIRPDGDIELVPEAVEAGYGKAGKAAVEAGTAKVQGATYKVGRDALVKIADEGVLEHETVHVFEDHFATPEEHAFARKNFGAEAKRTGKAYKEVFAETFQEWRNGRLSVPAPIEALFRKIVDFAYSTTYALGQKTRGGLFREIESGRVWDRPAQQLGGPPAEPLPQARLEGVGPGRAEANPELRAAGERYMKSRGLKERDLPFHVVDEPRAKMIADAYEAGVHNPNDPAVQRSYNALKREVHQQYEHLQREGYTFEPWTQEGQPYRTSGEMRADLRDNKHLYYFKTEAGFGEGPPPLDHPLLEVAPNGLLYSDMFRAVHDAITHAKEGLEFGARGEDNAWKEHAQMFSKEALPALTTETRGQNSWVNYGPHLRDAQGHVPKRGEPGYISPTERPFAAQKAMLLPPETLRGGQTVPSPYERRPVTPAGGGEVTLQDIARELEARTLKRWGKLSPEDSAGVYKRAVRQAQKELEYQLDQPESVHDWYKEDIARMEKSLQGVYPELADADQMTLFKAILAGSSGGNRIHRNMLVADDVWRRYKAEGRLPLRPEKGGEYEGQPSWSRTAPKLQRLIDQHGEAGAAKWLRDDHPLSELKQWAKLAGKGDEMRPGFFALGEKFGPFGLNVSGRPEFLTADRWFTRTWNRWQGAMLDAKGAVIDIPRNSSERKQMTRTLTEAAKKKGVDVADAQALLWYYEKRLYQDLGLAGEEQSFGRAAERLAESRGLREGTPGADRPHEGRGAVAEPGGGAGSRPPSRPGVPSPQAEPQVGQPQYAVAIPPAVQAAGGAPAAPAGPTKPTTLWDQFMELRRGVMLSGVPTHVVNPASGLAEAAYRPLEAVTASVVDRLLGGQRTRYAGEALEQIKGGVEGIPTALSTFGQGLRSILKSQGAIPGKAGQIIRAPLQMMGVEDAAVGAIDRPAVSRAFALREAKRGGGTAADIEARRQAILQNPSPEFKARVEKDVKERLFRAEQDPEGWIAKFGRLRSGSKILQTVLPFYQTPANIAKLTVERSPLGFRQGIKAYREYRAALAKGVTGEELAGLKGAAADALARPIVGTTLMGMLAVVAKSGGMTGAGPQNKKERDMLRETGWQPYSFRVGDTYIPFSRFQPVASLFGFAADIAEATNEADAGKVFERALDSFGKNVTSQTYLRELADALELISRPKEALGQYVGDFAGSLVPSVVAKTAQAMDPYLRETKPEDRGITGIPERAAMAVMSRVPGLSERLPVRRAATGAPLERPGTAVSRFLSPVQPSREKEGAQLERLMISVKYAPPALPTQIASARTRGVPIPLGDRERRILEEERQNATERARRVVASRGGYIGADVETTRKVLERLYRQYDERAKARIYALPEFRRRAREATRSITPQRVAYT